MFFLSRLAAHTRVATRFRTRTHLPFLLGPKPSQFHSFPYLPIRCLTSTSTAPTATASAASKPTEPSNQAKASTESSTDESTPRPTSTSTSTSTSNGKSSSSSQQSTPSWKYSMAKTVAAVASFLTFSYLADTYYRISHPHTHPKFPQGSVHEHIQSSLRTGDIVLFQRNPYTYRPFRLLSLALSKWVNASPHDHVGIIIYNREHQFPYVLEHTIWGVQLTPFDERVIESDSEEILIRKWEMERDEATLDEIDTYVASLLSRNSNTHPNPITAYLTHLSHLIRTRMTSSHEYQSQHRKFITKYIQYECDRRILQERAQAIQSTVPSLSDLPPSRRAQLERIVRQYMTTTKLSEDLYQQLIIFQQQYQNVLNMDYDGKETFPSAALAARILQKMALVPCSPSEVASSPSLSPSPSPSAPSSSHLVITSPDLIYPSSSLYQPRHFLSATASLPIIDPHAILTSEMPIKTRDKVIPVEKTEDGHVE